MIESVIDYLKEHKKALMSDINDIEKEISRLSILDEIEDDYEFELTNTGGIITCNGL